MYGRTFTQQMTKLTTSLMCRTADEGRYSGTFRTYSERFGYLRFKIRNKTSVWIAFVKILEKPELHVKDLQQSSFPW